MRPGTLPFTLRQLQYLVAVADELSFRRAAERCRVAQPSLSAQVARAEQALGLRLFDRDRRGVLLTAAGRDLIPRVRTLLRDAEELLREAAERVDPLAGTLRIGVIPTVAPYLLPGLDPALRAAFPRLSLHWTEDRTAALVAAVQGGALDAALLALEAETGDLDCATLVSDPFVLAAAPGHPLASRRSALRLGQLRNHDVLLLDDGHCFRDQALELCSSAGARELGFRATSMTTLVQMVIGSDGVTLLPSLAVPVENRDGQLVIRPFRRPAPRRTVALAWRRGAAIAAAVRELARVGRRALNRGRS